MRPATLAPEYDEALAAYRRAHGVLHYFAFDADAGHGLELHRAASLAAFELLRTEFDRGALRLTMDASRMSASPVSLEDFVGRANSSEGVLTSPRDFLAVRKRGLATRGAFSSGFEPCYLRAFVDPPYGVRLTPDEAQRLFDTINEHLFGGFADDLELFGWNTDWSNFFDAGNEWWGAFWWTVHNRTRHHIAVLAASTTD